MNDRNYLLVHDFIIKFVLVFNCCKNFPENKMFLKLVSIHRAYKAHTRYALKIFRGR